MRLARASLLILILTSIGLVVRPPAITDALVADYMTISGTEGDWVVGPQELSFTALTLSGTAFNVRVRAISADHQFDLYLYAATYPEQHTVGAYMARPRVSSFDPPQPGLSLSGDARGCTATGWFVIDELEFDAGGTPTTLVASWEQHCDYGEPYSVGSVSYHGDGPVLGHTITPRVVEFGEVVGGVASSTRTVSITNTGTEAWEVDPVLLTGSQSSMFSISDDTCTNTVVLPATSCALGVEFLPPVNDIGERSAEVVVSVTTSAGRTVLQSLTLAGVALPHSAAFVEGEVNDFLVGEQHISFDEVRIVQSAAPRLQVTLVSPDHNFTLVFSPPTGQQFGVGTYEGAQSSATADHPGIYMNVGSQPCGGQIGRFMIDEIETTNGRFTRLVMRWEIHCANAYSGSFGSLEFNGTVPFRDRSISPQLLQFPETHIGWESEVLPISVTNFGPAPLHVYGVDFSDFNDILFEVVENTCEDVDLMAGESCAVQLRYRPQPGSFIDPTYIRVFDDIAPTGGSGHGQLVWIFGTAGDAIPEASPYGEFTALTPSRILDTRNGLGALKAPIGVGSSIDVQITGRGGVPATGVSAVVVNATAVNATTNTYITLWPTGQGAPLVSNLNPTPGRAVPNMATIPIGIGGKISAYNAVGTSDLLLDVVGYYSDDSGPAGSRFHATDPVRLFDTRHGLGGELTAGETLRYDVRGGDVPIGGVTAVVLNVTATGSTANGFVTVHPGDVTRPNTSSLNLSPGNTVPNLVTVRVPTDGIVSFYNDTGTTHLIVDVVGYYSGERVGDEGRFIPVAPTRTWDSRQQAPLGTDKVVSLDIAGYDGIDLDAAAAVMNVTAVSPTSAGYLSVFPDDLCDVPLVSNLNFSAGQTVPNMVISKLSTADGCAIAPGAIDIYNASGTTHVLVDVAGYFL